MEKSNCPPSPRWCFWYSSSIVIVSSSFSSSSMTRNSYTLACGISIVAAIDCSFAWRWLSTEISTQTINHIKNGIFPLKMKGDDRVDVSLLTPFLTQRQSLLYIPQHHVIIRHIIGWLLLWGGFRSAYSCCNLSSLCIKKWKFHVILPVKNGHKIHTNNDSSSPTTLL